MESAGKVLEDNLGSYGKYLWGVGLLASGQASTMTGAFAGQYSMQGFLRLKMPMWKRVLITRSIAIMPSLMYALMKNPDKLDYNDLNVLQAIQLPFATVPLLMLCKNPRVMKGLHIGLP